jgi:hypothetical protein
MVLGKKLCVSFGLESRGSGQRPGRDFVNKVMNIWFFHNGGKQFLTGRMTAVSIESVPRQLLLESKIHTVVILI